MPQHRRGCIGRDLASLIGRDQEWLNTQDVLAEIDENLQGAMTHAKAAE